MLLTVLWTCHDLLGPPRRSSRPRPQRHPSCKSWRNNGSVITSAPPRRKIRHSGTECRMTRRAVVAIFDSQHQAYDAARAIQQLGEDTVHVRQAAIVIKDAQGTLSVPETTELGAPWHVLGGSIVGSMIGLLAGPVGVAAGILLGSLVGRVVDVASREQHQDFR